MASFLAPACRRQLAKSVAVRLPSQRATVEATERRLSSLRIDGICAARLARSSFSPAASLRAFSSGGRGGDDGGDKKDDAGAEDDPFGLNFKDSPDSETGGNLGSELPPSYVRDPTTGKFTGQVEAEMTREDEMLLNLTPSEKERALADRFVSSWNDAEKDETGTSARQGEVASRIRDEEMALNVLGRKPSSTIGLGEDDPEAGKFSKPLSQSEFSAFQEYAKREHGAKGLTTDDIPVQRTATQAGDVSRESLGDKSDPDLDLTWLSAEARSEMSDGEADDPFVDLLPSDLNPARKVNARKAKRIPPELLHHNNLSLLRRYVTPGGQIMNRVQSRLGARDQRKVAKLIKRARCLGLIPFYGQWKLEDRGYVHEEDLDEDREWEKELVRRGLVTNRRAGSPQKKQG
uniref:Ribosomal protein S18 n=1 Tax=Odontella aurita TaxID=265563 RepID=A0A7S4KA27_9STRA|eukprot:CAMPEP_0113600010 /NCGR_PEP_ID=MMETSP0015_2-20120614/42471_1 /TAXON_ID=2838 /ORGANISM="Odontella" /LENGTH=404 /DNA_ID=CAMNT_0000508223 /DNA_START=32 /DNA_END=1246 /DNA_ORIENTATION=+ /assembly_acc=CAM_ASM_000160